MARRNRDCRDRLKKQLVQVQRRFGNTVLSPISDLLTSAVFDVLLSAQNGGTSPEDVDRVATYLARALELLPSSFGDRFVFDSQLVGTMAEEYSRGGVRLSGMLVPKPSKEWEHQTVAMPSTNRQNAHVIDVIHLPGEDQLADIDLLDYPFICHELGHNILFRGGEPFVAEFERELDSVLAGVQRQTVGVRGTAKRVADNTTDQMRKYWKPTSDQFNWAHEIAADVISLWLSGPAYLAALQDVMETDGLNPYQLGQGHPPYEIRAKALVAAAGRLSWAYYTGPIQGLLDRWSAPSAMERSNLQVACEDPRLLNGAIAAAIRTCETLSLPCCTPERIATLEKNQRGGQPLGFGTDVLLAAWFTRSRSTETEYEEWERATIGRLLAEITG